MPLSWPRIVPTRLERAAGTLVGGTTLDWPEVSPPESPRKALEEAIVEALVRAPCLVSFSGGRDSSALLAVAAHVARREGLPAPVPVTVRFRDTPGAGEAGWQERVVSHLGLGDWLVLDGGDELDLVGPYGRRFLKRHGAVPPASGPLWSLLCSHAAGGSLVTGMGGDQVLGDWRLGPALDLVGGRGTLRTGELAALAYALSPRPVRTVASAMGDRSRPWLRPVARQRFRWLSSWARAGEPIRYGARLRWVVERRLLVGSLYGIGLRASDEDVHCVHPLLDPTFLVGLAAVGRRRGPGTRAATMRRLFSDLLPDDVLVRASKAHFEFAYARAPSRAFAKRWDGSGIDTELVDPERLRAAWLELVPNAYAALLLQQTWLESEGRGEVEQPLAHRGEQVEAPRAS